MFGGRRKSGHSSLTCDFQMESKVSQVTKSTLSVPCCASTTSTCLLVALHRSLESRLAEGLDVHPCRPGPTAPVGCPGSPQPRVMGIRSGKGEAQDLRPLCVGLSSPDLIVNIIIAFKREHKECICLELLITWKSGLTRRYEQL